jgi:hypothetical protein
MDLDADKFFKVLFQIFHHLRDSMGQAAWVILGLFLLAGIRICFLAMRWILHGGLSGSPHHFFAECREIDRYTKDY